VCQSLGHTEWVRPWHWHVRYSDPDTQAPESAVVAKSQVRIVWIKSPDFIIIDIALVDNSTASLGVHVAAFIFCVPTGCYRSPWLAFVMMVARRFAVLDHRTASLLACNRNAHRWWGTQAILTPGRSLTFSCRMHIPSVRTQDCDEIWKFHPWESNSGFRGNCSIITSYATA